MSVKVIKDIGNIDDSPYEIGSDPYKDYSRNAKIDVQTFDNLSDLSETDGEGSDTLLKGLAKDYCGDSPQTISLHDGSSLYHLRKDNFRPQNRGSSVTPKDDVGTVLKKVHDALWQGRGK